MSDYEALRQFVRSVSDETQQQAYLLAGCVDQMEQLAASFNALTKATQDPAARETGASFHFAQKQLLLAARALLEAAKAGYGWCGDAPAELKLVLKRRR